MAFPHTVSPKHKIDKILMDNLQNRTLAIVLGNSAGEHHVASETQCIRRQFE